MTLFTKSIEKPKDKSDGVRICVMRGLREQDDYDIWMPVIAPSQKLIDDYFGNRIDWDGYCKRYDEETLKEKRAYLELLIDMAKNRDVTIMCVEESPEKCHRRLIAEECKKIDPNLEVVIK